MRYLLSPRNRRVLGAFAAPKTLVALDFDGTLAPIVRDRDRAAMRPATRAWLTQLALLYPAVVISGRARDDVQRRLRGVGLKAVIGNHGIEPWSAVPAVEETVKRWIPLLEATLSRFPGVAVENKRFSIAVHYRHERRKQAARAAIAAAVSALGATRCVGGKQVVNILPLKAPHKGLALERVLSALHCDRAIYVGDDDTDEDVFALAHRRPLLAIRIGTDRDSAAAYYIRNQREVDRLMQMLIRLHPAG